MSTRRRSGAEPRSLRTQWKVATAYLVFVAVDADGKPREVRPVLPETPEDERRSREAEIRRAHRLSRRQAIHEYREAHGPPEP